MKLRFKRTAEETSPEPSGNSEMDGLVRQLQQENQRLKDLVTAKQNKSVTTCGYLYKYRAFGTGLLSDPWELRFFTLNGTALQYYKTERDTMFHPRGHIELTGTYMEEEGLKRRRYATWRVVHRSGHTLVRLSTESRADAQRWLRALAAAGCRQRELSSTARAASPPRSADIRWRPPSEMQPADSQDTNASFQIDTASSVDDGDSSKHVDYTSEASEGGPLRVPMQHEVRANRRSPMVASSPVHLTNRPSLLSGDRLMQQNYAGLYNLGIVVLVAANFRLIIENLLKYGVRFNPVGYVRAALAPSGNLPLLLCWPGLIASALLAFCIEQFGVAGLKAERSMRYGKRKKEVAPAVGKRRAAAMARWSEGLMLLANTLNIVASLAVPSYVVHVTHAEPIPGFAIVIFATTLMMKLVSYAHANWDFRQARRRGEVRPGERGSPDTVILDDCPQLRYPENINLADLGYFLIVPTLCYQINYPRSTRRRGRWLVKRLGELAMMGSILLLITEQYIEPTIMNSLGPIADMDWIRMFERLLKLALPVLYWWLIMFYCLFHLWLNIVAELTRFGDREFYKEWWNARTIGDYWRRWNMPVHKWMLRHVYYPSIHLGINKHVAGVLVFFVSAVFHELLVGLPLHMQPSNVLQLWSFWGIILQVPMIYITDWLNKKLKNEMAGNWAFWFTFCIFGQPLALTLYYHDWVLANKPQGWIPSHKPG